MDKKLFFLILLLSTFFSFNISFSQTKGGEAIYAVILSENRVLKESGSDLANRQRDAIHHAQYIDLFLRFNDKYAVYQNKSTGGMLSEDEENVLLWCNCDNTYYIDIVNKTVLYNSKNSSLGIVKKNEFLIENPLEGSWTLTNESKKINDLICYKATRTVSQTIRGKTRTKEITAWYAPEIPYSYGPNGYGGLPGLIVELQDGDTLFGLKSLDLTVAPTIDLPTEGTKISKEDYDTLMLERQYKAMQSLERSRQ